MAMLGAECSPCCGCRTVYDSLRSRLCSVTIDGELPVHPGASTNRPTYGLDPSGGRFNSILVDISTWTPERTVTYQSFSGPIRTVTEKTNWNVVAQEFQSSNTTANLSTSTLNQQIGFDKTIITSYKATQSPVGSHLLALDMSLSNFLSTSGVIVFKKILDDYEITCTLSISTSAGSCRIRVSVDVQCFYWTRYFIYSVSPTFTTNSATLTTEFLDANSLPYQGGPLTMNSRRRQYVPGTYSRQLSYLAAPLYVQDPFLTRTYSNYSSAQSWFDYYKDFADMYVGVWTEDLSLSAIGDWGQGAAGSPQRHECGSFFASGQYTNSELTSGAVSRFSFVNASIGFPTFISSSTKPSPYSGTAISIPAESTFRVFNPSADNADDRYLLADDEVRVSGQSETTFYNRSSFAGLTSTTVELQ